MIPTAMSYGRIACVFLSVFLVVECEGMRLEHERSINPAVVVIGLEEPFGVLQRPAVAFDHGKHTDALKDGDCKTCHLSDAQGKLFFNFIDVKEANDPDVLMKRYHDKCMSCHKERTQADKASGPVVCGECHMQRPQPVSSRDGMGFDYSLHYRHVVATDKKCETCHHVYNEKSKMLEYKAGESEDACRDCHGEKDDGKKLSLRNASHSACVNCHLERRQKNLAGGPTHCIGCHDADVVNGYVKLTQEKIERLKGNQPDKVWITAANAKSKAVAFDHEAHEPAARFCTTCHHRTRRQCRDCHTLTGKEEGGFVTIETAHHLVSSERSCFGCHKKQTENQDCAGCHAMPLEVLSRDACGACHNAPIDFEKDIVAIAEPVLASLPTPSDDGFPKTIIIKALAEKYEPSEMPHQRIVARLDQIARDSRLARGFHEQTETLCAGCHHHSPLGARPVPCTACHSNKADPVRDKPALKAAYHRQCMGCHQRMKIESALECTKCHQKAAREVSK